jgi:Prophage CP4-57 regulatory protein (AlpA).
MTEQLHDRVVPPKEAALMLGVSTSTLWVLASEDDDFPPRIQMTERRCGWRYSDLNKFIDGKTSKITVQ